MKNGKNIIIIENAKELDYFMDYVALPKEYPGEDYYNREDVKAIVEAVHSALNRLDAESGISKRIAAFQQVIIKPNLVNVFHNSGYYSKDGSKDSPGTTDPRVFDALCSWVSKYNMNIVIAESSGKPLPTIASFKTAGYDKIAKRYNAKLIALEHRPVVRYMLPKAEIMKEILIPDIFDDVVKGKAFYISVPKMKTNIYTGVTLSIKNAMGTIPYFLRERNHTHDINKKIADILYLYKPDMVLIDGIIGGEGNTPAPVDPIDMHMIVASDNPVEADRITTYMMGFEPSEIKLIQEVDKRGFGTGDVTIVGEIRRKSFRPASPSLMQGELAEKYPYVTMLAGHTLPEAPVEEVKAIFEAEKEGSISPELACKIEKACVGGCLSSLATGYASACYGKNFDKLKQSPILVIAGPGIELNNKKYWFDKEGKAWSFEDIKQDKRKKLVFGKCAGKAVLSIATWPINSCCDPVECLNTASNSLGIMTDQLNPVRNNSLVARAVPELLRTCFTRISWIKKGYYVDVPRVHEDRVFDIPSLSEEDMQKDFIPWPFPEMTKEDKRRYIKDMLNLTDSLRSVFERFK